jgi:hypothetical protein
MAFRVAACEVERAQADVRGDHLSRRQRVRERYGNNAAAAPDVCNSERRITETVARESH